MGTGRKVLDLPWGQPFFYMAFACCVNVYMVSVHTSSTFS